MHRLSLTLVKALLMAITFSCSTAPADEPATPEPSFPLSPELQNFSVEEIETAYAGRTPPEGIRMYLAIQKGSRMGAGEGWFGPAQARYTWDWLAQRTGADPAEPLPREKFSGPDAWFARLDRNRDGAITQEDLDWSDRNSWVQHAYVTNRLFRKMDPDGDGRLSRDEWLKFFDAAADGREVLTAGELRDHWLAGMSSNFLPGDGPTPEILLKGLFSGEVGSMHEGPSIGDQAPDFTLQTHDEQQTIQLSKLFGSKPVVLVFGNFTCGPFRSMYPEVDEIARRYQNEATFVGVYVREAHPTDGWRMSSNDKVGVEVAQPTTLAERVSVAGQYCKRLKPSIPVVVDTVDDAAGHAYSGMPARLYVIDRHGKVTFKSGRGPFGFKPGEMEQALLMTLLDQQPAAPDQSSAPRFYDRPRFPLVDNEEAWKLLPSATTGSGQPLPHWARALARHLPHTVAAILELDQLYRTTPQFSPRERGLIRLAAATVNRSGYGLTYAGMELRYAGVSTAEIESLTRGCLDSLVEADRRLYEFAAQLSRAGRDLTDSQVEQIRNAYGEDRLVGIVLLTAYANFQDRLVHALALPLEPEGPLRPLKIAFAQSTSGGSLTPAADRPALPESPEGSAVAAPDWSDYSFAKLQERLSAQRDRQPRIAIPEWSEVISRLPQGLYNPDKPLRIRWSRLVIGRQPELGPAWIKCLRVFGREAHQDRVFEESVFWAVTRELRCFYCMGHCEMLLEVGGLNAEQIAGRTRQMAESRWEAFAPAERTAFALAARLTADPASVTDEDLKPVLATHGEARTLDLIWWIARCQFMTKVSDAFQLSLERDNVFADFEPPQEKAAQPSR